MPVEQCFEGENELGQGIVRESDFLALKACFTGRELSYFEL
jgi:hypothetical protein